MIRNDKLPYLRKKAGELPETPGVYLMHDKTGKIIYVGKSKKLKNRVSSYFIGESHTYKTEKMVEKVFDFETILCDTEIEALALENNLIKKYTPKYNIKLKDAKSYPYLKITAESYPRLTVTRERKPDGGRYFGPYSGTQIAYDVMDTVKKTFCLPTCKRIFPRDIGKERPCIYKSMGRCVAPCDDSIGKTAYRHLFRQVSDVLNGNLRDVLENVTAEMMKAAEEERFEEAARYRDTIESLKKLKEKQKVVGDESSNADIIAFFSDDIVGVAATLSVRDGKLLNAASLLFSSEEIWEEDGGSSFILSQYADGDTVPKEILLANDTDEEICFLLSEELTRRKGRKVTVRSPKKGDARKMCDMALVNAEKRAAEYRSEREKEDKNTILLAEMLKLEVVPDRVEAYDISNIGDECITASMVVYENGALKKSDYRTFRVRIDDGRDDFASMKEALSRRLSHIGEDDSSLGRRPDLILLDGGKGQVSAVREAMETANIDIPLFGMVKDDFHKTRALTDGENEIGIAREPGVYAFVYRLQEEAHRVAYSRSQNAKRKTLTHSELEKIPGIGPAKAKILLSAFGGIRRIAVTEKSELTAVRGITESDAEQIYHYFHEKDIKSL